MTSLHSTKIHCWRTLFVTLAVLFVGAANCVAFSERMAAFHETFVATDTLRPNSCIATYMKDKFSYTDTYHLARLVVGVEVNSKVHWSSEATSVHVEDFAGGVRATFDLAGVKVTTEAVPLMIGRGTPEQEGAAIYVIQTEPAATVVVKCGGSAVCGSQISRVAWLRDDAYGAEGDKAELSGDIGVLSSTLHPLKVAVKATDEMQVRGGDSGSSHLETRIEHGQGWILIAYAPGAAKAREIVSYSATSMLRAVHEYYASLNRCKIETPEPVMDEAFRTALYNLEYNWLYPYGWNECIHHWFALWYMQHTGAAEWIGQVDRSRDCNITTAENLLPDGSIPQFCPNGTTRKDFGGSNQFFSWQVRHYWQFTADKQTIARLAPALYRSLDQTFEQYDKDCDGLLCWGQQIGNQEDYVSTPFNGSSPAIEGINMLHTAAQVVRTLGDETRAEVYEDRARAAIARLRSELWQPDLGRYAFYKDPAGVVRPDGQYHTLIYPVIWGMLDPLDSWTSIRHLRDRLIGENGETYCSNNFPCHVVCTCGPQAGAAQQPWAAWGLAAVGLRNETYRPLKAVASWVMDENHRGSWPEVSVEATPAYFSPPAGLYIQAVIEALFGLSVNKPEGYLSISPSFPDSWPKAKLTVAEYTATYARTGNTLQYTVTSAAPLERRIRWMLPPCKLVGVKIDGKPVSYKVFESVNGITLHIDTPPAKTTEITIGYAPISVQANLQLAAVEGGELTLSIEDCEIDAIDDRCGVLQSTQRISPSELRVRIKQGLLEPYADFGPLGQMNFAKRTFFIHCIPSGADPFWAPVDVTVLPALFVEPTLNSLGKAGEQATASITSPEFEIGLEDKNLLLELQGGISLVPEGPGALSIDLLDSSTGELLRRLEVNGSHLLRDGRIPLDGLQGRKVRMKLVDNNTSTSYAWLGVRRVALSAN